MTHAVAQQTPHRDGSGLCAKPVSHTTATTQSAVRVYDAVSGHRGSSEHYDDSACPAHSNGQNTTLILCSSSRRISLRFIPDVSTFILTLVLHTDRPLATHPPSAVLLSSSPIDSMQSILVRSLLLLSVLCLCTLSPVSFSSAAPFDFATYLNSTSANGQFGGYQQSVAALLAPLTLNGVSYPAGSFLVWGGALNSAVVPITYSAAAGTVTPYIGSSTAQVGSQWSIGCAARSGSSNQFYEIGTFGSISQNFTRDTYFVQSSTDAVTWTNVLDAGTIAAWLGRANEDNTLCVVDSSGAVYSVGQEDTWKSSNKGVTFSKVSLTSSRFSNRTFFAGGMYTSSSTDYIMVLGGRGAPNAGDPYGYYDSNDVWQSSNGGQSWSQLTSAAAWAPRDQFAWTYTSGMHVINGGDVQGGYGGFYGDVWTSTDGINWAMVCEMTSLGAQSENSIIFDSMGYLYFFGGQTNPPQYTLVSIGARSTTTLTSSTPTPTPASAHKALDFQMYLNSTSANGQFGGYQQSVAALLAPLTLNGVSYPAGSFLVWGGALNSAVVPITYSAAAGTVTPYIGSSTAQVGSQWSIGCAARSGSSNQFYEIGTFGSISQNFTRDTYFVQSSTDAVTWTNVLDAGTIAAWLGRANEDNTLCVVDSSGAVYSVGQEDTWKSSNKGVTFSKVSLTSSRFSNRTFFAGGMYTSSSTDYIMVLGGRGAPNAGDPYGYYDSNDVWQSSNGGQSWSQLTAAAAWAPRDQFAWTYSSSGLHVINGGDVQGGYGGFYGDVWTSTDGINWVMVCEMTSLGLQSENSIIFDSMGYLYFFGGQTNPPQYTLVSIGARSTIPLTSSTSSAPSTTSTLSVCGMAALLWVTLFAMW